MPCLQGGSPLSYHQCPLARLINLHTLFYTSPLPTPLGLSPEFSVRLVPAEVRLVEGLHQFAFVRAIFTMEVRRRLTSPPAAHACHAASGCAGGMAMALGVSIEDMQSVCCALSGGLPGIRVCLHGLGGQFCEVWGTCSGSRAWHSSA